jgi:hypothetical protein
MTKVGLNGTRFLTFKLCVLMVTTKLNKVALKTEVNVTEMLSDSHGIVFFIL